MCCSIIQCALQSIDVSLQQLRGFVDTRVLQSVAVRVALNMCTSSTGSHHCGRTCVAVSCSVLQCVLHLICIPFRQLRGNTDTVPTAPSNRCSTPHKNCAGTESASPVRELRHWTHVKRERERERAHAKNLLALNQRHLCAN